MHTDNSIKSSTGKPNKSPTYNKKSQSYPTKKINSINNSWISSKPIMPYYLKPKPNLSTTECMKNSKLNFKTYKLHLMPNNNNYKTKLILFKTLNNRLSLFKDKAPKKSIKRSSKP